MKVQRIYLYDDSEPRTELFIEFDNGKSISVDLTDKQPWFVSMQLRQAARLIDRMDEESA